MSEDRRGECKSEAVLGGSNDGEAFTESMHMFGKDLVQVVEDRSFFPTSEDEGIGVELLLAEPKCNDLGDDVLGFNTFSQNKCFDFGELSVVDYGSIKIESDALDSNHNLRDKDKELSDEILGGSDAMIVDARYNLSDACEDYLLDTEFADESSDVSPIKGSYIENLDSENQSMVGGASICNVEISELFTVGIPEFDATCQDSTMFDKMTIDELHGAFKNMFGRETTVTDKQWLRRRLSFGWQNLVMPPSENEGKMISPTEHCCERASSPLTGMFDLKKRPRVQHAKREKNDSHVSLKALSTEVRKAVSSFPELGENENVLLTRKRSRKPTRRYIEESLEEDSKQRKRRYGISATCPTGKILHGGSHKRHGHRGFESKPFVCKKAPFKGACIQVPFGEPVHGGHLSKKVRESDGCKGSTLRSSSIGSDVDSLSNESQDDLSENDYNRGSKTQRGTSRRKHHMYWSLSEVLKLVEGVSMYGVGRWTEIKKLLFRSSGNRTSVDLKDKWRNLLRACCSQMESNREVEPRKKHASQLIPESILHRVRELAARHPYPRERKTQVPHTASVTPPLPATNCDNLVHLSTAVKV